MAIRSFYNEIKGLKVTELPKALKPKLTVDNIKKTFADGFERYRVKYIETDSADPIYHVCFGGMLFSYIVALPQERRHMEHEEAERLAKLTGEHTHHHHHH